MPSVLVCGGAGYIGSFVARAFLNKNYKVIIYDNLSTGHLASVPKNCEFAHGDVLDSTKLIQLFQRIKIDVVIHLCAYSLVGESVTNPLKYFENNVSGAISLFKAMTAQNVKNIIFSSSAAIFGEPTSATPISETAPKLPINPYGTSKLQIEQILQTLDLNSTSLRYFNAGGAAPFVGELHNPETHLVPCVCERFLQGEKAAVFGADYPTSDGSCVRDYVHVLDLADAHVLAADRLIGGKTGHDGFNLGSGNGYTVLEVVKEVQSCLEGEFEVLGRRAGDPAYLVADCEKAKKVLGWVPKYGLKEIVQSASVWHKGGRKFE